MSIRDQILKADDLPSEQVEVPEWGVALTLRGLTAGQAGDFLNRVQQSDGTVNRRLWNVELVMACAYDGDTLVFDRADRDALLGKPAGVIGRVARVAARLSGLAEETQQEAAEDFGEAASDE